MNEPRPQPRAMAQALAANKQFVAVVSVLLLVLVVAPGSPARALFEQIVDQGPAPAVGAPATTAPPVSLPLASGGPPVVPAGETAEPTTTTTAPPPALVDPIGLPDGPEPEPPPTCSTDAVADLIDTVRAPLGDLLGAPVPGAAIRQLAAIAAGCSEEDPTGPTIDLAVELGSLVPDLGLGQIDLPDLPGIDLPVPPSAVEVLAPLAPAIRDGCAQVATIALIFVVLPPAFNVPFSQSDLIQFLGPTTALCALFDEGPA